MTIYMNEAYSNGRRLFDGRSEVLVTRIDGDRISFREIVRWDAGYPSTSGVEVSTTRERFQEQYPDVIDFVQAP